MTSGSNHPVRRNRSFLAEAEQALIQWILPRLPENMTSLQLTAIGMLGSFIAAVGLVGCNWSPAFLPAVVFGVALNWFGDSLDGSLARYRHAERPRFGFLVDHTCDLFSQILIIVAFALSPFLTLVSALVILICYLLFSAYTYIRAAVHRVHQMSYIGVGATEFRILMIVWAAAGVALNLNEGLAGPLTRIDIAIMIMGAMAVVGLGFKAFSDAREIALIERPPVPARNDVASPANAKARDA